MNEPEGEIDTEQIEKANLELEEITKNPPKDYPKIEKMGSKKWKPHEDVPDLPPVEKSPA